MLMLCFFLCVVFFFFKQKTAYEMRISDWSSDVCSSDLSATGEITGTAGISELGASGDVMLSLLNGAMAGRGRLEVSTQGIAGCMAGAAFGQSDRKRVVSGKRVSGRVDQGGRRYLKKKKKQQAKEQRKNK